MRNFVAERTTFIAKATPGIDSARTLSQMTDEAVRALSRAASARINGRWAIAALGGWGAGALLPASDLDILILSDAPPGRLKPFVEALLYPLWDAGLKVGHQVRSPREQRAAIREDIESLTAALTGRPIAGDLEWAASTLAQCAADTRRRSKAVLRDLEQRRRTNSPYHLEPGLKDGAGGRRDYDELTWTAATLTGAPASDPSPLLNASVLLADEFAALTEAAETITQARWRLHLLGYGDKMTVDAGSELGGFAEKVQGALGTAALVHARGRARARGRSLSRACGDTPFTAGELFALLDRGEDALEELEYAAQAGLLDAVTPGLSALMPLRRPGLGHQLTVGAHCLKAACMVTKLSDNGPLDRSRSQFPDLRTLQAATLAHDAGKIEGGPGHADRGALSAARTAAALGLGPHAARDAADLVRLHLLLADTAHRADLDDEDTILRCAAHIGRRELLAALHLMTAADSLATGPSTWTPWTAALVDTLVARVDAAFSPDVDGVGLTQRGESVREQALALLHGDSKAEREFVQATQLRYLASRDPAEVVSAAHLVAELSSAAAVDRARIAVTVGPVPQTYAVTVAAVDRPRLLARLAGALSLAGLSILSVDAYGTHAGIALDTFVVSSATAKAVSTETFAALERFVHAALRDRLELATRLAERRRHYRATSKRRGTVDIVPSGWDTTVRVVAPDRPGLLHDLAQAVAATEMDIRWAKVSTIDGVARDTFHVVGADGGPVDDPGLLGHLAMRLREVL